MKTSTIERKPGISMVFKMVSGLALVLLLFTSGNVKAQYVSVNHNGSFELSEVTASGDTGSVAGWQFFVTDTAGAKYAIVDTVSKDGAKSLAITVDSTGADDWSLGAVAENVPVVPGESYKLTLWAKASESGATANFTIGVPVTWQEVARIGSGDVSLTTEWKQYSLDFDVPSDADTIRVPLHFSFPANVGKTIYLDSVRVTGPNLFPIIVEAESGELASDLTDSTSGDVTFITTLVDNPNFAPGATRIATYDVSFPGPGAYDLFARVRVGSGDFTDDSFFYGAGFGTPHPDSASQWVTVNGMAAAGFTAESNVLRAAGGAGSGVWKWVNLSRNNYFTAPVTFIIEEGDSLTQTFQLGTREDGLDIDKFAFGDSAVFFTVANMDNGTAGSLVDPSIPTETFTPIAEGKNKFLGNIHSGAQLPRFEEFWNQVTPENAGKWGSVEGTRDQFNWTGLDDAYYLAKDNGLPFRFHVLVWGGQQPDWINDLEPAEQLEEITEWFEAVAERYPDIDYLEVVNEGSNGHQLPDGISGSANYIDALGGTGETGHDWIITAFEMAREIFPSSVKLMINDYGIVGNVTGTQNYVKIINNLKSRGLIDVIGVQAHAFSVVPSGVSELKRTLDMLAATGLHIMATEMDIDGDRGPDGDPIGLSEEEAAQAQLVRYQRIFPVFWEHPNVIGVTLWGWRPGMWRDDWQAYLVSQENEFRPALDWLRGYVDTAQVEVITIGIEDEIVDVSVPGKFELGQNYPNPFNPSTNISYTVPSAANVKLNVYDISGRLVKMLVNTRQNAGKYTVSFQASDLSSGLYFYELSTPGYREVKKMLLVK